jgi:hypothetical protein
MDGTLEEAFAQADADINNDGGEAEEETVEEEVTSDESVDESEDVESKEEASLEDNQESFTKVNPDELPEELKGVYKSLQADYTRKTQDLAEKRKSSEQRIEELEKKLEGLNERSKPQDKGKTPKDHLRDMVKGEIEAEKIAGFREQAISDYEAADERLKLDSETYDKATDLYVGQNLDERLSKHVEDGEPQYTFDYKNALKEVLSEWDEYVQNKQKAYLEKQQKQAKEKAKKVQKQNPKAKSGRGTPKKPTLEEAIALAQKS